MTHGSNTNALNPELTNEKVERIYHDWDAALARLEELPLEMDFVESMELNDQV